MSELKRVMENITWEQLCDLMCGAPEEDYEDGVGDEEPSEKN